MTLELQDYEELEESEGWEEENILFKYAITSYGADYPVDGLVRRIQDGSIYIPPFQRSFVWSYDQSVRFIESLLLGLPVPGIFLSREQDTQKLLVIDGQQRLRTLQYFYEGAFPSGRRSKKFELKDVQPEFEGKTYATLDDGDRRRLDDSILHATIVKQDEPSEDNSSIYHIFERLNTSGTRLRPQEIRAAIYRGAFNDLLGKLNEHEAWRKLFGTVNKYMRDQELILRFFALYHDGEVYSRPMKSFLNAYMSRNRHLKAQSAENLRQVFVRVVEVILEAIGDKALKPKRNVNAAISDAVMVGVARRLDQGQIRNYEALRTAYESLLKDETFVEATEESTSNEENVRARIELAISIFDKID